MKGYEKLIKMESAADWMLDVFGEAVTIELPDQ